MSLKLGLRNRIRRTRAPGGFVGLLDQSFASGATAAYSLRLLRAKHSGGLIRVRASDSGTNKGEADVLPLIQPDGSKIIELDSPIENLNPTAQNRLGTNAGGGQKVFADLVNANGGTPYDGFIPDWYDQTGNGNHASNATAAEQPKIFDSSSGLVKENGKPALDFDGSDDYLGNKSSFVNTSKVSVFSVNKSITNPSNYYRLFLIYEGANNYKTGFYLGGEINTNKGLVIYKGDNLTTSGGDISKQNILTGIGTINKEELFVDGAKVATDSISKGSIDSGNIRIGANSNNNLGENWEGTIQEIIFYEKDKGNRTNIESNINGFYSVF